MNEKEGKMNIKVTFDFAASQIIVEGTEGDLLSLAKEAKSLVPLLKDIHIVNSQIKHTPEMHPNVLHGQLNQPRQVALRDFVKKLPLSNSYEKIAAIGYHAIKIENKTYFTVKELNDWFSLCGFQKPSQMAVALSDAKRKYGYVASKGRDQWTITTGGENLILEMLERQK